jgi:hypothetical protein
MEKACIGIIKDHWKPRLQPFRARCLQAPIFQRFVWRTLQIKRPPAVKPAGAFACLVGDEEDHHIAPSPG